MRRAKPEGDDELVTAFVDGVSELDGDDRRRVEALLQRDPGARADADSTRELLGQLRDLPAEGNEPNWVQLEQQIRAAVAPLPPAPWWRKWRWLVPVSSLAVTAAIALVWLHGSSATLAPPPHEIAKAPAVRPAEPAARPEPTAIYLDGEAIDVEDLDPGALLDELDQGASDPVAADGGDVTGGILPATDLGWIDSLDDGSLERAEQWLEHDRPQHRKKS